MWWQCGYCRQENLAYKHFFDDRTKIVELLFIIGLRGAVSPYGAGPGGVVIMAGNDMNVQLLHNITKRADIELLRAKQLLHSR